MQEVLSSKSIVDVILIFKDQTIDFSISTDMILMDFKHLIQEKILISLDICFLFYNHLQLIPEIYDGLPFSSFIIEGSLNIIYLLTQDDYYELNEKLDYIFCHQHIMNKAHLYCKTCDMMICDSCCLDKHQNHNNIIDQSTALDAYFSKVNSLCLNLKNQLKFDEEKLLKGLNSMRENLDIYLEAEKTQIQELGNELKSLVDEICNLETSRIENLVSKAKERIELMNEEGNGLIELFEKISSTKDYYRCKIDEFNQLKKDEKSKILISLNKELIQLLSNEKKTEKILKKLNFNSDGVNEFQYSKLINQNKDQLFKVTVKNIHKVLRLSFTQIFNKAEDENYEKALNLLEDKYLDKINSNVYCKEIDFSNQGLKKFYQSIDNTNEVLCVKLDTMKVVKYKTKFKQKVKIISTKTNRKQSSNSKNKTSSKKQSNNENDAQEDENFLEDTILCKFPKYSRSITIGKFLYSLGGENETGIVNYFLEVDTENDFFVKTLKPMSNSRSGPNIFNYKNKKLFVISGAYGEKSTEYYDFEKNSWIRVRNVNYARVGANVIIINNLHMYLFFGKSWINSLRKWDFIDQIEKYKIDSISSKWEVVKFKIENIDIDVKRAFSGCFNNINGGILILGGQIEKNDKVILSNKILEINFEKAKISECDSELPFETCFINPTFYNYDLISVNIDVEGNAHFRSALHNSHWIMD